MKCFAMQSKAHRSAHATLPYGSSVPTDTFTLSLSNFRTLPSPIALGCWQLGADWGAPLAEDTTRAILTAALDGGVDFLDTADVYGDGRSERLIGDFLAERGPHNITVATKFGRAGGVYPDGYTRDALRRATDASRERLRTDRLDLLQLHCIPTAVLERGEVFDWLRELRSEGAIAAFGASVETIAEGHLCLRQDGIASLQVLLSPLRQRALDTLVPAAAAQGVTVIARVPLASGLLTGKFTAETTFPDTDHRHYNRDGAAFNVGETFGGLPFRRGVALAAALEEEVLAKAQQALGRPDLTLAQLSLRFLVDQPGVTTIIPGASTPQQARDNAAVMALGTLPQNLQDAIRDFYRAEVDAHVRGPY